MMLAGQLPEDVANARLVLQAMTELVETFLAVAPAEPLASNILPFTTTG